MSKTAEQTTQSPLTQASIAFTKLAPSQRSVVNTFGNYQSTIDITGELSDDLLSKVDGEVQGMVHDRIRGVVEQWKESEQGQRAANCRRAYDAALDELDGLRKRQEALRQQAQEAVLSGADYEKLEREAKDLDTKREVLSERVKSLDRLHVETKSKARNELMQVVRIEAQKIFEELEPIAEERYQAFLSELGRLVERDLALVNAVRVVGNAHLLATSTVNALGV